MDLWWMGSRLGAGNVAFVGRERVLEAVELAYFSVRQFAISWLA